MPFYEDERLGMEIPQFDDVPFESLPLDDQEHILVRWESIRARIPDRIMHFEHVIEELLQLVHHEEDWDIIASYFAEISDYASRINELNTWRRVDPSLELHHMEGYAREHFDKEK